ncbi:MAG: NAD(+)/NADH kinase [Clostridiales bacterium]|nr:NAD(+)/NADH kinase [Clostridiales bacterium]
MKVGIYFNKTKNIDEKNRQHLISLLEEANIEYLFFEEGKLEAGIDFLLAFGGDGTILYLADFASKNDIPIIGINFGKLGFLTEFELDEIDLAIKMLKDKDYKIDKRSMLKVDVNKESFYALNDVVLERVYEEGQLNLVINVLVKIDNNVVDCINGDGVIVGTPTGSTAYSLSAGGDVLAPEISGNIMTPINAHSLHNRSIVFSSSSEMVLTLANNDKASLLLDGKRQKILSDKDKVVINQSPYSVKFLRKKNFNFYGRLLSKLNRKGY